ncbi:MAG TPA: cytochrome c oxidase assembly protein, partial [Rhodanobacteraceae bacterium]|nr:cytochrome c oxidase assembly protein [Rhodanobacteraceae bacterium]
FFAGLAVLWLTLVSPLDALAEDLFSAHMVQHMLLLLVVPPLLVYGRPVITWLWAFDLDARRAIARGWKRIGLEFAFRWLMKPLCVWLLLAAALCFWHLPGPYDAAVRREWLHDLEHASFLFFSLAFWTIVIEPYGRRRALGYGATMVFIVSSGVVMGLLGAVLTFASAPLYAVHVHATPEYGLTALQDQQLAGIIMWIPSNLVHVAALSTLFFAWFRADESGARRAIPRAAARLLVLCAALASLALVGCARDRQAEAQAAAAHRGARLIAHYGCGACHSIPGINGADGLVGPPLDHWSRRSYIAGVLPNDPANLTLWIRHPQAVVPGVDMPEMGVKAQDARDIAAYLYSIR